MGVLRGDLVGARSRWTPRSPRLRPPLPRGWLALAGGEPEEVSLCLDATGDGPFGADGVGWKDREARAMALPRKMYFKLEQKSNYTFPWAGNSEHKPGNLESSARASL